MIAISNQERIISLPKYIKVYISLLFLSKTYLKYSTSFFRFLLLNLEVQRHWVGESRLRAVYR